VADEIGHLQRPEDRDEGTQRGLDHRVELAWIDRADVDEVQHLAQEREPDPVPQEARDLPVHANRPHAHFAAEAHRGRHGLLRRSLPGDDLDEDDQLRLYGWTTMARSGCAMPAASRVIGKFEVELQSSASGPTAASMSR
jgi:hypothetical protein